MLENNKLYCMDNLELLKKLPDESIDLMYSDILYGTGRKFKDYDDLSPNRKTIENFYIPRIKEMHRVLKNTGSIYLQMDYRIVHWVRCIMDDVFGYNNFKNEIIWQKIRTTKSQSSGFGNVHDNILIYNKTNKDVIYNKQYKEFDKNYIKSHYKPDKNGRLFRTVSMLQRGQGNAKKFGDIILEPPNGMHWIWSQDRINSAIEQELIRFTSNGRPEKIQYLDEMKGDIVDDLWCDIPPINSQSKESIGYDTQKPKALLERIIKASSNEGDIVADFFCGSGTTCIVAKELGRQYIGCDINSKAIEISQKRLDEIN